MLYGVLQWIGGIALHWFYSDVRVVGRERVPLGGPLLVAVNHQNALVDAVLAQWVVPRPLRITAKATLAEGMAGALMVRLVGIIPLRRISDEPLAAGGPTRNRRSFQRIVEELRHNQAILVFPEGKSHNEPTVAPLKTGLARAALRARESGVTGIHIVPIGLTFESKAEPGTAVLARVGDVIAVDGWAGNDAHLLTAELAARLAAVSFANDSARESAADRAGDLAGAGGRQRGGSQPAALATRLIARWGNFTHRIPIRLARRLALRQSSDEGEPAMYTMTYGLAFTLLGYAIQVPIVWLLGGGVLALLYLVSLVAGAYYAAYSEHHE